MSSGKLHESFLQPKKEARVFNVDMNVKITDIIELVTFVIAVGFVWWKARKRLADMFTASRAFETTATVITSKFDEFKASVGNNLTTMGNNLASLQGKIEAFDKVFVRKDVHDAHIEIIKEQVKGLTQLVHHSLERSSGKLRR